MKFTLSVLDHEKLRRQEPYRFDLATASRLADAATIGCALARSRAGQDAAIVIGIGATHEHLIYCNRGIDDARILAEAAAALVKFKADQSRNRKVRKFRDRFRPNINADFEGWTKASNKMNDPALCEAFIKGDFAAAEARALEIGLTVHEPAKRS